MEGPVQWALLSFLGGIAVTCAIGGFITRGFFAGYDTKIAELKSHYDIIAASLSNAIQDRNFLQKYDSVDQNLRNDLDHLKNNFKQHQMAASEDHDNMIRMQSEVDRLGKIVNGKH